MKLIERTRIHFDDMKPFDYNFIMLKSFNFVSFYCEKSFTKEAVKCIPALIK